MTERAKRGWTVLATLVPMFTISVTQFVLHRVDLRQIWPVWRPMLLDLTLVLAVTSLVAGAMAGVVAWRRAPDA